MPESAKEGDSVLPEGSDIGLGCGGREFEPRHSDHIRTPILIQSWGALFCLNADNTQF